MTIVNNARAVLWVRLKIKEIERGGPAFTGFESLLPDFLLLLQEIQPRQGTLCLIAVGKASPF